MKGFVSIGMRSAISNAVRVCLNSCRGSAGRFRIEAERGVGGVSVAFGIWRQLYATPADPTFILSDTDLSEVEQRELIKEACKWFGAFVVQKEIASANVEGIG